MDPGSVMSDLPSNADNGWRRVCKPNCNPTVRHGPAPSITNICLVTVLSHKSNKSSRESTANSHSPASYRNATGHRANSVPKRHANNNGHGKRRGDRRLCRRSPMAASMRLQLLGQEMFCEAFCHFPDDYVGTSAFAVQALHFNTPWTLSVDDRQCLQGQMRTSGVNVCFVPIVDIRASAPACLAFTRTG